MPLKLVELKRGTGMCAYGDLLWSSDCCGVEVEHVCVGSVSVVSVVCYQTLPRLETRTKESMLSARCAILSQKP